MAGLLDIAQLLGINPGLLGQLGPQYDGDNHPIPGLMGQLPQMGAMAQAPQAAPMGAPQPPPAPAAPAPAIAPPAAPQATQPAPQALPPQAPQSPSFLQRLSNTGGVLGGIAGTIGSLTGQTTPGINPETSQGPAGQAYRLMLSKGVDPATAKLMASTKETAVAWMQKNIANDQYKPITGKNGEIIAQQNISTGKMESDPRADEPTLRIVNEMYNNPTKYGFKGPDDPSLHEAARQKLSGQSTNVSVNTAANPVLEGVTKQLTEGRKVAVSAARQSIPAIHQARQALDEGANTGAFAEPRTALQKFAGLLGFDTSKASNTESLRAALGDDVLAHIKELGTNPSNTDRTYIEMVKGGKIELEEKTIRKMLDIKEKYARQAIQNFNDDAKKLMSVDQNAYRGVAPLMSVDEPGEYKAPDRPAAAPAPAARPAAPAIGTIQDGHRFKGGNPALPQSWEKVR